MPSPRKNLQYGHEKHQHGRRNEFRSEYRRRSRSRSRSREHERQRRGQQRETKRYEDRSRSPVSRARDNRRGARKPSSLSREADYVDRNQRRNRSKELEDNKEGDIDEIDQQTEPLPVAMFKDELMNAVKTNQVLVCTGETGSGKTTQIPQYLLELVRERDSGGTTGHTESDETGLYKNVNRRNLMVAVTQPRRVAATSVARRVADECGCRVGEEVGYSIRFEDRTGPRTRIKYMTDGVLVRECLEDPQLSRYGVVMLDEAHERSINTDILFGLVKRALARRPDLHSVITSATLDVERFTTFFNGCPSLSIPGRTHAVDVYHSKTRQVKAMGSVGGSRR